MPTVSIGDMSQHFMSLRNTGKIKSDLARLAQELSTGRVEDISTHLRGNTQQFSGVSHSLGVLSAYSQSAKESLILLDQMQLILGRIDETRSKTADALLLVNQQSQPAQLEFAAETARSAFSDMIASFNSKHAERSLFGGGDVDQPPLPDAVDILADIVAEVGPTSITSDVIQVVSDWFDSPTGGFNSTGYQGSTTTYISRAVGKDQSINLGIRADDSAIREILKAMALAAIVPDISSNLSQQDQGYILQTAGKNLLSASVSATSLQSRVGQLQEYVASAQARNSSEVASLSMIYNDFVSADPFDTATKLEAIQLQLETHFAATSRLSRLSLVEYI